MSRRIIIGFGIIATLALLFAFLAVPQSLAEEGDPVVYLFNGSHELLPGSTGDPRLECQGGQGHLRSGDTITLPATCRLEGYSVSGPWVAYDTGDLDGNQLKLEFATVELFLHNHQQELGSEGSPRLEFQGGIGEHASGETLHLPPDTTITYRLESYSVSGPWLTEQFDPGDMIWDVEFATVTLHLHNHQQELGSEGNPRLEFQGGIGEHASGETLHLPPGDNITYRLESYSVSGPWLTEQFDPGDTTWNVEFATVTLFLHNNNIKIPGGAPENVRLELQGGIGEHASDDVLHLPPGANITYRLESYSVSGPWLTTQFSAGDTTWNVEFATVELYLRNGTDELEPGSEGNPRLELQGGIGEHGSGETLHLPPGANITYRLESFSVSGGWQVEQFDPGDTTWDVEFATVNVLIDGPGSVELQGGLGHFSDGDTFHVPPETNLTYRMKCCANVGGWETVSFKAGDQNWELSCPLTVYLFNGAVELEDPHRVEVSGSGQYTTGDTIPWEDVPANGRLRRNGVIGPWMTIDPADDDGSDACRLELEFATVNVTLFNDANGNDHIDTGETLDDPHRVEVSGVGQFTTGDTFHVPPGTTISSRLRRNGVIGPWANTTFIAGENDLELEFATVEVTLVNGDEILNDPHRVEVSGVGQFTTDDTFHVPPGTTIRYRLRRNGVIGPWDTIEFDAGENDFELEFATVEVTLFNDANENSQIDTGETLGDPHRVEVSGVGQFTTDDTFHVPPGTTIRYRLRRNGVIGPWLTTTFSTGENDLELEFATVEVTLVNGDEILNDPHRVEVSGVGQFTTDDTFHVPPGTTISYRLRRNGVIGPWANTTFIAGENDFELEFATVEVTLFNDANGNEQIDTGETLGNPHRVEVSGVGQFTTDDTFHVPPGTTISYRLRRNGVIGPWADTTFIAGENDLELEFATVTFSFDLPSGLLSQFRTEVSGVAQVQNDGTVHLPPGATIRFRVRDGGWTQPWVQHVFGMGNCDVLWDLVDGVGYTGTGCAP
jgi:hypothetical protein